MKLNHLNLTVSDVTAAHSFLETYFGLKSLPYAPKNQTMAFLNDDNGMVISLMNVQQADEVSYPGMFHIGFVQESREVVDAINKRLKAGGFAVKPAREFHGSYTFYLKAPGGFTVEVLSA